MNFIFIWSRPEVDCVLVQFQTAFLLLTLVLLLKFAMATLKKSFYTFQSY